MAHKESWAGQFKIVTLTKSIVYFYSNFDINYTWISTSTQYDLDIKAAECHLSFKKFIKLRLESSCTLIVGCANYIKLSVPKILGFHLLEVGLV